MKKILLFALTVGASLSNFAQDARGTFFAQEGEKFYVVINGVKYNEEPQTNVKVTGLSPAFSKIKIIFDDQQYADIDKSFEFKAWHEASFSIVRKEESGAAKGFKKLGHKITKDLSNEFDNKVTDTTAKEDWYVLRFMGEAAYGTPPVQQTTVVTTAPATTGTNTAVVNSSSTTTTTNVNSTNTSASSSAGGTGISMNVNINANTPNSNVHYQETTTTSTTVTSTGGTATQEHYVMPGYSGPVGCPWPMSEPDYQSAVNSIKAKSFEDSRLTMAKQITNSNCLTSAQVKGIMQVFDFEQSRLDYAKYAYGRTYDIGNYYKVNDAFDFESSIEELDAHISAQGR